MCWLRPELPVLARCALFGLRLPWLPSSALPCLQGDIADGGAVWMADARHRGLARAQLS